MGESEPELRRTLGLVQVVLYGVGLILGAGIYVVIGDAAAISGNVIWISFILAAVVATFTGLSYAELASMFPKCAAEYICPICWLLNYLCGNNVCRNGSDWFLGLSVYFFTKLLLNSIRSYIDNHSFDNQFIWH